MIEGAPGRPVRLVRSPEPCPGIEVVEESRRLLDEVGAGRAPETVRLLRLEPTLAFGPADTRRGGHALASKAAREHGFAPVVRAEGGHAAAADEDTLALCWTLSASSERPRGAGIHERYVALAQLVAGELAAFGLDARVGAVPGEYCPGSYSVNLDGRTKVMGVAQRVSARAAQLTAWVTLDGAGRLARVLTPVYAALDLEYDARTVGSVSAALGAPLGWDELADRLVTALGTTLDLVPHGAGVAS